MLYSKWCALVCCMQSCVLAVPWCVSYVYIVCHGVQCPVSYATLCAGPWNRWGKVACLRCKNIGPSFIGIIPIYLADKYSSPVLRERGGGWVETICRRRTCRNLHTGRQISPSPAINIPTIPHICHRHHRQRLWRKNWSCGEILPVTCCQVEISPHEKGGENLSCGEISQPSLPFFSWIDLSCPSASQNK